MTRTHLAGAAVALLVVSLVGLGVGRRVLGWGETADQPTSSGAAAPDAAPADVPAGEVHEGFLYGRVVTVDGEALRGRLRFGGGEEAFWRDYLNGVKDENRWAALVSSERLPREVRSISLFGLELARRERTADLARPFMARLGDVRRIEWRGSDVRVTLKSGTVFDLDWFEAGDFGDGVRVWDERRGAVDLDSLRIREIELLAAPPGAGPLPLHGTVTTRRGTFTGFLQWNREDGAGSDTLDGRTAEGDRVRLRFDTVRSIARRSAESALVVLADGRELLLSGTREVGDGHRGTYVDDPRYGRVLVSWDAFERVELRPAGGGPAYDDFLPGRPLVGSVTTRDRRRLAGRLVYDLDESETTETLDAPADGIDYTLPFGRIASIVLPAPDAPSPRAAVTLHGGETLRLELAGDLGAGNAGLLVFPPGAEPPEYLSWPEVARIDLERP